MDDSLLTVALSTALYAPAIRCISPCSLVCCPDASLTLPTTVSKKSRLAKATPPKPAASTAAPDRSTHVHQRPKLDWALTIRERNDLTERQKAILEAALHRDTRCIFIDGIWGSSKTWLSVLASLKLLNAGRVDQILYIRNPIEASSTGKIGYLKGTIEDKLGPYNAPLYDKLDEMLGKADIDRLTKENRLECIPLGFTRGRSWNCKAIIVDEAASMTWDDLLLLLSRCGEFTRVFFVGDSLNQNDLGSKSGFRRMFNTFDDTDSKENGVWAFELRETTDIVRSRFLRYVMAKTGVIKPQIMRD